MSRPPLAPRRHCRQQAKRESEPAELDCGEADETCLLVTSHGRLVGLVTVNDLTRAALAEWGPPQEGGSTP